MIKNNNRSPKVCLLVPICFGFFTIPSAGFNLNLSNDISTPAQVRARSAVTSTITTTSSLSPAGSPNIFPDTWRTIGSTNDHDKGEDSDSDESSVSQRLEKVSSLGDSLTELKQTLTYLFNLPNYKYIVGAMTCLYFVVTGVQYWVPSYMLLVLTNNHPTLVNVCFIIVVGTSPTSGVIFGGKIVDYLGGYRSDAQRVFILKVCFYFGCIAVTGMSVFYLTNQTLTRTLTTNTNSNPKPLLFNITKSLLGAIRIIFVDNLWEFVILLWIVLFFGAAVLPPCSGIVVSSVPSKYRGKRSLFYIYIFYLFFKIIKMCMLVKLTINKHTKISAPSPLLF